MKKSGLWRLFMPFFSRLCVLDLSTLWHMSHIVSVWQVIYVMSTAKKRPHWFHMRKLNPKCDWKKRKGIKKCHQINIMCIFFFSKRLTYAHKPQPFSKTLLGVFTYFKWITLNKSHIMKEKENRKQVWPWTYLVW